jgi:hypothetical protein
MGTAPRVRSFPEKASKFVGQIPSGIIILRLFARQDLQERFIATFESLRKGKNRASVVLGPWLEQLAALHQPTGSPPRLHRVSASSFHCLCLNMALEFATDVLNAAGIDELDGKSKNLRPGLIAKRWAEIKVAVESFYTSKLVNVPDGSPRSTSNELSARVGQERTALTARLDQDASNPDGYVLASKLWRNKFESFRQFKVWLMANPNIRTQERPGYQMLIHAADWANHWGKRESESFEEFDLRMVTQELSSEHEARALEIRKRKCVR